MRERISDKARLSHIVDAIRSLEAFTEGIGIADFLKNDLVKSASVRQMEIIGEAANHITAELKEKYSEINWKEIVGFRNIAIHEYFVIDYTLIWDIIENSIPQLKVSIEKIILEEFNTNK